MKRIDKIHLKNFKAFRDQEFQFDGKNVLIYGNNGSGKSSLFWSIYTFLQSSNKSNIEIQKYFLHFDEADERTYQSLKNVNASDKDESFVSITWIDENKARGERRISYDLINTNIKGDTVVREANLVSDFINYKLLQNFYNETHKEDLNLWKVFMKDIFPFFTPTGNKNSYHTLIEYYQAKKNLPKDSIGRVQSKNEKEKHEKNIKLLNSLIDTFLFNIQEKANEFLKKHFFDDIDKIKIDLKYLSQINFDEIRDETVNPKIRMKTMIEVDGKWIGLPRPQSFLNEASLTRIALAVRIGALQTRIEHPDFKVLCLDDLLISLDMSNRMQVLNWLFNSEDKLFEKYQLIILTHDRRFYNIVKHQIATRLNSNDWKYYEMFMDEHHKLEQPYVSIGDENIEIARKHFMQFDFAACANYLRKECEKLIKNFLPEHLCYEEKKSGDIGLKSLEHLVAELKTLHTAYSKDFSTFQKLKLYKDILMNPLSHDNFGTSVYQNELLELMDDIIPKLSKLKSEIIYEIERGKEKLLMTSIVDKDGVSWDYHVQIFEHIRKLTFADGTVGYTNPKCKLIEAKNKDGENKLFNNNYPNIGSAYRRICGICGVTPEESYLSAFRELKSKKDDAL